jgi:hypothetical protein
MTAIPPHLAEGVTVDAVYRKSPVTRFAGNAFIEALPGLLLQKADYLNQLAHYPPTPNTSMRRQPELIRIMEISTLNDLIVPFPEYQKAGITLATIIRESYVARNPLTVLDRQRRYRLATCSDDRLELPSNWKSAAKGFSIFGVSGMGKTTLIERWLLGYPQVIRHESYDGTSLICLQLVFIKISVPHDATLYAFCLTYFSEIDRVLGTDYERQARSRRRIGAMTIFMNQVATTVSLGLLVVDDVQNLQHAKGNNAALVLNIFSAIVEQMGVSLVLLATPALQPLVEKSFRNSRKISSMGQVTMGLISEGDSYWQILSNKAWDYCYLKHPRALTFKVRHQWYRSCAGDSALMSLSFQLAQRSEIGGREFIDETSFLRVMHTDLSFVQPVVDALLSKSADALLAFEDLIISPRFRSLTESLGLPTQPTSSINEEFAEVDKAISDQ